jgi:hypothetical protein
MNCGQRGTRLVGEANEILSDSTRIAMFTLFTHVHSAVNKLLVRCTPRKPLFYIPFLSFFLNNNIPCSLVHSILKCMSG